jgi:uncharacterized protein with PIN domain
VRAELSRTYASPEEARALRSALAPDQEGFVSAVLEGATLRFTVTARHEAELRRTLEDLLACLAAAERTWEGGGGAPEPSEEEEEEP